MTTPNANNDASTTTPDVTAGNDETLDNTGTESLLTGQDDGEATGTDKEIEDAMLAGWSRIGTDRDNESAAGKKLDDVTDVVDKNELTSQEPKKETVAEPEDLEIAGLGMKASEVKAQLARLDALEKSTSSTAGHLGHLKQMVQQAGKGKAITAESLKKVSEEFGAEYAQALAEDLTAAGIGGGASVDEESLGRIVNERVAAERDGILQAVEKRMVRKAHPDAADYFAGGKHNADFMQFLGTLPKERQEELADTWDSDVINPVLDEFKAQKKKVETDQTKQQRRLERSALPTAARGSAVAAPSEDPLMAGWNNVNGRGRSNRAGARS